MVGKTKAPTKEESYRMSRLNDVGCICCLAFGVKNHWTQVHHIVEGGKRLGHDLTIPLCTFHHEGVPPEGLTKEQAERKVGPSLKSKRKFNEVFGDNGLSGERNLLEWTNRILEKLEEGIVNRRV